MSPSKAPGPDGLPVMFYQKFWSIVGPKVVTACLAYLNDGESLQSVNDTLICLIPKRADVQKVTDFRPISLCNVIYKIVAKALANRFRCVIGEVVSDSQSAFVPGRLITNNVIIGHECMYALRTRRRKRGSVALKLDMSKAYDRVKWGFLERIMMKLGLWMRCVMGCVNSVSYSFLINGNVCVFVRPSRGLRLGDPMSPYLYLLVTEGLSNLLRVAMEQGVCRGFRCDRSGPVISHLFFAYDSLLFTGASAKDCLAIRNILGVYSRASGQQVNFEKSSMCVSKGVSSSVGDRLARLIGVQCVRCLDKCLGIPDFASKNKKQLYKDIKKHVWNRIRGWQGKLLSIGGREVLIKAVIQSIPTYSMSLFRLPRNLLNELHGLCNRFW
ncbi:hypothetical protein Ddye_011019 [Dipteronia dyeriana]|uniref:Reverse transcriptase domain-containing protein n=1 Tax=Dipteronia dyeriana TaxID=168575 RepID=A0AAD9XES2_9ROSI|nr:hypothetical protein Ddye_011019 [Dipteronia dyeriana]